MKTNIRMTAYPWKNINKNPSPTVASPAIVYLMSKHTKHISVEQLTLNY